MTNIDSFKFIIPRQFGKTLFYPESWNSRLIISEYYKKIIFMPVININYKRKIIDKLFKL